MTDIHQQEWPIQVKDDLDIRPVTAAAPWLHGARTAPFATPQPGACFTRVLSIAE